MMINIIIMIISDESTFALTFSFVLNEKWHHVLFAWNWLFTKHLKIERAESSKSSTKLALLLADM